MDREIMNYQIRRYYLALRAVYGAQHWWPAHSRWEVIVGALMTQNTSWRNAERALANLRQAGKLSLPGIRRTRLSGLVKLLRPAGYFRQKARRLKIFVRFLDSRYQGSLDKLFAAASSLGLAKLRQELLSVNGIGPETADAILLYAGNFPVFVADAYARRVLVRHGLVAPEAGYEEVRAAVEESFSPAHALVEATQSAPENGFGHRPSRMSRAKKSELTQYFNELHALFVHVGKRHCHKSVPQCEGCPLQGFLPVRAIISATVPACTASNEARDKAGSLL